MDTVTTFALLAGAGIFLAWSALVIPPQLRLERPGGGGLMARLQERLDAAELPVTAREFAGACLVLAGLAAGVAFVLGSPALALAGLVVAPALLWQRYEARRDAFRQQYDESLAEVVQLLREGFAGTGAMEAAMEHAVRNGPDPAGADFRDVVNAHRLGADLAEAFVPVTDRRRNAHLQMVAEALTLKAKEGGSVGEVLAGLETMVREQVALRREIYAKQSTARIEGAIVSLAPTGFFLAMKLAPWMRDYEAGFYSTAMGQIVLSAVIVLSLVAFFLARKLATRGLTLEVKEIPLSPHFGG
jgi:tight adherence protein B